MEMRGRDRKARRGERGRSGAKRGRNGNAGCTAFPSAGPRCLCRVLPAGCFAAEPLPISAAGDVEKQRRAANPGCGDRFCRLGLARTPGRASGRRGNPRLLYCHGENFQNRPEGRRFCRYGKGLRKQGRTPDRNGEGNRRFLYHRRGKEMGKSLLRFVLCGIWRSLTARIVKKKTGGQEERSLRRFSKQQRSGPERPRSSGPLFYFARPSLY